MKAPSTQRRPRGNTPQPIAENRAFDGWRAGFSAGIQYAEQMRRELSFRDRLIAALRGR